MPLSPEVKQIVDALSASARGGLAMSAGLEKVDARLKGIEGEVAALVEELKEQNIIERTGQQLQAKKIEHVEKIVGTFGNWLSRALSSKPAIAIYMTVMYLLLSWMGVSPTTIRAFLVTYLGGSPPGGP